MFRNEVSEFIYKRTYARWLEDEKRREEWPETVARFISFLKLERGDSIPEKTYRKIEKYLLDFAVMPSMRFLWSAGEPASRDNTVIYNCSFAKMNSIEAFAECLHILMCGTGFGFSVEEEEVKKCIEKVERELQRMISVKFEMQYDVPLSMECKIGDIWMAVVDYC